MKKLNQKLSERKMETDLKICFVPLRPALEKTREILDQIASFFMNMTQTTHVAVTNNKYIIFNMNIIIAGIIGLSFSAYFGNIIHGTYKIPEITSLVSTILHLGIAIAINSILHYFSNKRKYIKNRGRFGSDLLKIYGTQAPAFFLFYFSFFLLNDLLLRLAYTPIISIAIAYSIGTLFSRIIHTYLVQKAGVFSK